MMYSGNGVGRWGLMEPTTTPETVDHDHWLDNTTCTLAEHFISFPAPETHESLEERVERLERELQQLRREMREIALPRIYDLEGWHPPRKPLWAMPKAPYKGER